MVQVSGHQYSTRWSRLFSFVFFFQYYFSVLFDKSFRFLIFVYSFRNYSPFGIWWFFVAVGTGSHNTTAHTPSALLCLFPLAHLPRSMLSLVILVLCMLCAWILRLNISPTRLDNFLSKGLDTHTERETDTHIWIVQVHTAPRTGRLFPGKPHQQHHAALLLLLLRFLSFPCPTPFSGCGFTVQLDFFLQFTC